MQWLSVPNKINTAMEATTESRIIAALKEIYDPEIPVNIYDLGLIYQIEVSEQTKVRILMTLTTPNCPEAESMPGRVHAAVAALDGIESVEVNLTFDPSWSMDNLSEEARVELGLD